MKEYTHIANAVDLAKDKTEYDIPLKQILANKDVLAWIASRSVKELKGYPIDVIKDCIEGEPEISSIPVAPGQTNEAITGQNTEDNVIHEGTVYFDIRFTIMTPGRERIRLILNVEAQKKFKPGYDLVTRGIYYGARMISSQKEREFTGSDYDNIKKVYSIWICMNAPKYAQNTITEYSIQPTKLYGNFRGKARYDLMSVIFICLGKPSLEDGLAEDEHQQLLDLLSMISSSEIPVKDKLTSLENDYHIATTREVKEGINSMCNWSEGIIEQALEMANEHAKELYEKLVKEYENNGAKVFVEERAEELAKELAEERAKERAKELAEERAKELAEERAKELAEERAKELAKKWAKELAEERARELAEERARELAEERARELAEERAMESTQKNILSLMKNSNISFNDACNLLDINSEDYVYLIE